MYYLLGIQHTTPQGNVSDVSTIREITKAATAIQQLRRNIHRKKQFNSR